MMYPGPAGGFAELFPSPAKGHDLGLSDEQNAETQALVSAQANLLQSQINLKADAAQTIARWPEKRLQLAREAWHRLRCKT